MPGTGVDLTSLAKFFFRGDPMIIFCIGVLLSDNE
jgi:hypothetical protein